MGDSPRNHLRELDDLTIDEQACLEHAARMCGEPTLCPDDLIRPCVLPAGHEGFHDGGR